LRIISQLVPNGQPVSTDIEAAREPGRNTWEIPTWGHPLALGVYPLFVTRDRRLIPIGTAFCISKLGVSVTALHNISESFRRHWHGEFLCQMDSIPAHYTFGDIGMAVFHHQVLPGAKLSGNIWSLESIDGVPPTDAGYIFPQFRGSFPYLPLPISFTVPRIGARVVCVGFSDLSAPDNGLSLDDIECGRINLLDAYEHRFLAVEGRVTRIFTRRFTNGFVGGPCYTIDAEINQAMCGGPVFSENGYVCGFISAGATNFFGEPTSIISLLYPSLVMNIRFGGQIGPVRINSNRRLIELIAQGAVTTDGSENLVTIRPESCELFLGSAIYGEDAGCYDDLSDLREGRHATGESKEVFRFSHGLRQKD
jgi:hypothetical protein